MKFYLPTLKHLVIQLAKLQIYTLNLTTTFWHCKKNPITFEQECTTPNLDNTVIFKMPYKINSVNPPSMFKGLQCHLGPSQTTINLTNEDPASKFDLTDFLSNFDTSAA